MAGDGRRILVSPKWGGLGGTSVEAEEGGWRARFRVGAATRFCPHSATTKDLLVRGAMIAAMIGPKRVAGLKPLSSPEIRSPRMLSASSRQYEREGSPGKPQDLG
jgi:hypothetical protein